MGEPAHAVDSYRFYDPMLQGPKRQSQEIEEVGPWHLNRTARITDNSRVQLSGSNSFNSLYEFPFKGVMFTGSILGTVCAK